MSTTPTTATIQPLTAADVIITVSARSEERSAFQDLRDCLTKKQIQKLLERAESNVWEWCNVTVQAEYTTEDGREISDETYLGMCSYKSRQDFIKNSDYYGDMIQTVLEELTAQL